MSEVLYFGYASCMLTDRMKNSVPNPKKYAVAELKDYKLVFHKYNTKWNGHFAHALPSPGSSVWGVIWSITETDKQNILQQESVDKGVYEALNREVYTPDGKAIPVFFVTDTATTEPDPDAKPSPQYKGVIVGGAVENGLPEAYVDKLKAVQDNGYTGQFDFRDIKTNF